MAKSATAKAAAKAAAKALKDAATAALVKALTSEIAAAATVLATAAPSLKDGEKGKTYEAWVMFRMAATLKDQGWKVRPRNSAGNWTGLFRVRGGPGHLPPAAAGPAELPCHFLISSTAVDLELHNSVEHVGRSGAVHEVDVGVVSHAHAAAIRATSAGGPYDGPRVLAAELKAHDETNPLPKSFARALVGLAADLDPAVLLGEVSVTWKAGGGSWTVGPAWTPRYWLATTTTLTSDSALLLDGYQIGRGTGLRPGSDSDIQSMADQVSDWLLN